ncbi:hypothetical protein Tco_0331080 [Tanacetum coccineum]
MFMHTARDDSILGTMRFISMSEDFQIYGSVLPKRKTNQQMRESNAYKTYLTYATGVASPKMKRKVKKPASLSNLLVFESETLLKKALRRIKQYTTIHKVGNSSEGADSKSEDPDEPKSDNHDEEKEIQDDEYVHTLEDYVHTNDETNDEYKEFDEEEYEELYGDVNISLKDDEPADKEKVDDEPVPIPSSSISSDYAAKYLNLDNIPPVDTEVVSMLEINFQHEALLTLPLLTIPVVTNLEKDVKELKTVDFSAALLSTIKYKFPNAIKEYLGTSLDDALYKVLQKHSADITKEHYVLAEIVERLGHQYVLKKSIEDIRNIKMEHERQ